MFLNNKIRCFLSLAESKSFTLTAKKLFLTQQAVSKNIARMEEELGLPLFIRNSRNVELTPAGEECYQLMSGLANQYHLGIAAILQNSTSMQQNLRLGLQSFLNFGMVIEAATEELKKSVPGFQTENTRHSPLVLQERLKERQLDLVLVYRRFVQDSQGLEVLELTTSPRFLMISPNNPLVRDGATWEDFKHLPLIMDSIRGERTEAFQTRVQGDIDALALKPSEIVWVPDRDSAYTCAESGRGVVVGTEMSRMAQARHLKSYPTNHREVLLAVWETKHQNPLVERYARQIRIEYEGEGGC